MIIKVLRLAGYSLYFIGGLILVPAGMIILTSPNTLLLAGPIAILLPVLGVIAAGIGKWLTYKALRLEKDAADKHIVSTYKK